MVDSSIVDLGDLSWQYRIDYKDNLYSTTSITLNYRNGEMATLMKLKKDRLKQPHDYCI